MKCPWYRARADPTPSVLCVCESCNESDWVIEIYGRVRSCLHCNKQLQKKFLKPLRY